LSFLWVCRENVLTAIDLKRNSVQPVIQPVIAGGPLFLKNLAAVKCESLYLQVLIFQ